MRRNLIGHRVGRPLAVAALLATAATGAMTAAAPPAFASGFGLVTGAHAFDIGAGERKVFHIEFKQGQNVEIWITSDKNTDIDIFVFDAKGVKVAEDQRDFKDCYVSFTPQRTETFKIEVVNINRMSRLPVGPNRCTMKWTPKN